MSSPLVALFLRELRVARRIGGSGAMGVAFFLVLVSIVPFAVGPDPNLLARIGPAILWIAALLASLLCLDRLFQADAEDGSLDLLHLGETPLELAVLAKCLAHWTATGLPLVIAAPLLGLMLQQDGPALLGVMATLLAGTPALTLIGAIGAAATVTVRRGGLLDGAAGAAVDDSGVDLRGFGGGSDERRDRALRRAFRDSLRDQPRLAGALSLRGGGGVEVFGGVGRRPAPCIARESARRSLDLMIEGRHEPHETPGSNWFSVQRSDVIQFARIAPLRASRQSRAGAGRYCGGPLRRGYEREPARRIRGRHAGRCD